MQLTFSRADLEFSDRFAYHEDGFVYIPGAGFHSVDETEEGLGFTPVRFERDWYSDGWEHIHDCTCEYCRTCRRE